MIPQFQSSLTWAGSAPKINQSPDVIIATGRKAAAVGKFYRDQIQKQNQNCQLIQILNPKDKLSKYDLVLIPEHDAIKGPNVINFLGSIHPYGDQWYSHQNTEFSSYIAVILGNPDNSYFESEFIQEMAHIRSHFPNNPLFFCGSPRMHQLTKEKVLAEMQNQDKIWLDESDGSNPYLALLRSAFKLCVSADSINMISESCQSQAPVSILAKSMTPSAKHQKFIQSIEARLCALDSVTVGKPVDYALDQIMQHRLIHSILGESP